MRTEKSLETMLTKAAKAAGGLSIKLPAFLYRGIPDRMILLPVARVYFVEVKREDGVSSPHQLAFHKFLLKLGFNSYIIYGTKEMKGFIDGHIKK